MTQLLISVTNVDEAKIALENGADIIDLKDPSAGALGALPLTQIREVVSFINGKKMVSATIGDLPMHPEVIAKGVQKLVSEKVDYIKIGFFEAENYVDCLNALKPFIDAGIKIIAVLFAEYKYPDNLIALIKNAGLMGIMLDTSQKNGLTFFDHYSEQQRVEFTQNVLHQQLTLGLAGSLTIAHVALVRALKPSYIGFRGGVCEMDQRVLGLRAEKISALCKLL
jgi:uncharacterized protein (UPF0264 family)